MVIVLAVWGLGYGESILHPTRASNAGPVSGAGLFLLEVVAAIALGFLIPRFFLLAGPVLMLAAIVSTALYVITYDDDEGASLWGLAVVIIPAWMVLLSAAAWFGRAIRKQNRPDRT